MWLSLCRQAAGSIHFCCKVLAFRKALNTDITCLGNDSCILRYKETTDEVIGGRDLSAGMCLYSTIAFSGKHQDGHLGSLHVLINMVAISKNGLHDVVSAPEGQCVFGSRLQLAGQSWFSE